MSKRPLDDEEYVDNDNRLLQMQRQIKEVLGKEKSVVYFKYLKDWLRGRSLHDEIDSYCLALMPKNKADFHTEFLLAFLDHCELSLAYDNFNKTNITTSSASDFQSFKVPSNKPFVRGCLPVQPRETQLFEKLSEVSVSHYGWLPHKGQVKGRFLLAAWEMGFDRVSEEAINFMVSATKILMMNLLEASVRLKRNHLVTESGITHSYGIFNRSNVKSISRITLPASEAISARDLIDAIQVDPCVVRNASLQNHLVKRLKAAEALEFES